MIQTKQAASYRVFLILLFAHAMVPSKSPLACTVFNKTEGNTVLFGNVENNLPGLLTELHFIPPNSITGDYGHFFLLLNGNIGGGMNDQGLCFDVAGLPNHPINTEDKAMKDLMAYLLKDCATLQDALDFFKNYYWVGHNVNHLMVMDKTGASAVVEHIGNTVYIFRKEGNRQVMTNYSFADPDIRYGDYPCPRYITSQSMLDTMSITVANMQKVCEEVSHAYYSGLYANILNPKTLEIYLFNPNIHSQVHTFDLAGEMAKGSHYYTYKNHQLIMGVEKIADEKYRISNNRPNPFSQETMFSLELKTPATVEILVANIQGQVVETLDSGEKPPGSYQYIWTSSSFPAGIYLCKIYLNGLVETRKWVKKN
jgi:choloylglycine hydrolase